MFDKLLKKITNQAKPEKAPEAPTGEKLFAVKLKCHGTERPCKTKAGVSRAAALSNTKPGAPLMASKIMINGAPAYMVLNEQKLDIGEIHAGIFDFIAQMVNSPKIYLSLIDGPDILLTVYGSYKRAYDYSDNTPGPSGKEYAYHVNAPDGFLTLPPDREIKCKLTETAEGFDVIAAGGKVGTIPANKKERLKDMLDKYECKTTLLTELTEYMTRLKMIIRF